MRMDSDINLHQRLIQQKCRVCNGKLQKDRSYPVLRYRDIILKYYSVDVQEDDALVHPSHVCDKHRAALSRLQKADESRSPYSTNLDFHTFQPHNEHCILCSEAQPRSEHTYDHGKHGKQESTGRKRKRPSGPGRGKSCSLKVNVERLSDDGGDSSGVQGLKEALDPVDKVVADIEKLNLDQKKVCIEKIIKKLTNAELAWLAYTLGQTQYHALFDEAYAITSKYRTLPELATYNITDFLENSNTVVLSFILGCCTNYESVNVNNMSVVEHKKQYLIGITMEMMYKVRYASCIAPLSFMRNLASYVGHDKAKVMKIHGASSPGGSYTTVTSWIQNLSSEPVACPEGDVIAVFDNDQVIGKTYGVKPQNRVKASVITNMSWIQSEPSGKLQADCDLLPGKWLDGDGDEVLQVARQIRCGKKEDPLHDQLSFAHREQLTYFLQVAIREVLEERISDSESKTWRDVIDLAVEANKVEELYQWCHVCNSLVLRGKRLCTNPDCRANLKAAREQAAATATSSTPEYEEPSIDVESIDKDATVQAERYAHVPHNHPEVPPEVVLGDPVFANPNSYVSLTAVLRKIGEDSGIHRYGGDKRHWIVVCCDGLPYHLCMKLIKETFMCSNCKQSFFGSDVMQRHLRTTECNGSSVFREFDWVLLKIGGGHYEANMMKAFMELNWEPFMSQLCHILSFQSILAQQSAKRCDDHHKTWAILVTFHLATLKELVVVYVRDCVATRTVPSPSDFKEFANKRRHIPNFWYMYDMVCKYSQAIINFRMGTRRCNSLLVRSAKHIFKEVFHGRNHPIYSLIEINDTIVYRLAPAPVQAYLDRNCGFSKSGDKSKGQDADYILEETNKETKCWIPRGVPEDETWLKVCRNIPHLRTLNKKIDDLTEVSGSTSSGYRKLDVEAGVHAWRCKLRETEYLMSEDLQHTSITGEPLHSELASFRTQAAGKRANHISALFDKEVIEDTRSVFITEQEEREKTAIHNQTVPQIKKQILSSIPTLIEGEDDKAYFFAKYESVKGKKKAELVKLYHEIENCHNNQGASFLPEDNEDTVG